jgi:signal transduction histidine kinase
MRGQSRVARVGLRWRITLAFLGGALAVSALVAGTTFFLAERYLSTQRIDSATQQSFRDLRFAVEYLSDPQDEVALDELVGFLEARGEFKVLMLRGEQPFSSFSVTTESVPPRLATAVARGDVGYAFRDNPPELVFGSPIPWHDLSVYFFYPLGDLEATLTVLRNVLLVVSGAAVLLAAAVGSRVSRRVVNPVRRASEAARRVAEGLLETRLPVVGRDELGALADSFNEMAAALEERIARERRFVGDVSHELRTPLTTLQTSTDYLLKRKDTLPRTLRRATELLAEDLQYLQRLVGDLLEISKAEAGRVQMQWERLNLADVAREVVARRARGRGQTVRLEVDAGPEALDTIADKQRLERVVGNLVDNALIHGDGRDVTVRVGSDDGLLLLSVEDLGPGVPREALTRIFERFFKADPARQRADGRGSGLGLAIARENAHLHGGDIDVDSGRGRGARFTLRLPRRDRKPQE